MPLEFVGLLTFINPDWANNLNYPSLSKVIPWYEFIILGLIIWGIATALEATKKIQELKKDKPSPVNKQTNIRSKHMGNGNNYTAEKMEIHHHHGISEKGKGIAKDDKNTEPSIQKTGIEISLTTRVEHRFNNAIVEIRTAYLEVKNEEDTAITDCYATLEKAEYFREPFFSAIPIQTYKNRRLKWDEKYYPDKDCKLNIPPTETREIRIFKSLAEKWDEKGNSDYGFSLCSPSGEIDGYGVYILKIRIDGKQDVDGKDIEIKPIYFEGYLYIDMRSDVFDAIEHYEEIKDGERIKHERRINQPYTRPVMYFEDGDWQQDQRILIERPIHW